MGSSEKRHGRVCPELVRFSLYFIYFPLIGAVPGHAGGSFLLHYLLYVKNAGKPHKYDTCRYLYEIFLTLSNTQFSVLSVNIMRYCFRCYYIIVRHIVRHTVYALHTQPFSDFVDGFKHRFKGDMSINFCYVICPVAYNRLYDSVIDSCFRHH